MALPPPVASPPLSRRPPLLPKCSASSPPAVAESPPSSAEALEAAFGRKGIRFSDSRPGGAAVEMSVRNGSTLKLNERGALITSYKPKVYWKDGADAYREALYTVDAGDGVLKGGIGVALGGLLRSGSGGGGGTPWSASEWAVRDSDANSIDAVQVELACTNVASFLDVTYVVTLYELSVASAIIVENTGTRPVELTCAVLSHIKFDTRRGTAVEGLRGCMHRAHPPPPSSFGILSPAEAMAPDAASGWFSFGSDDGDRLKGDEWVREDDVYTILKKKTSRVYAAPPAERLKRLYSTPPSKYTTIDQASGLGFRVIRMEGFGDIYLSSPGGSVPKPSDGGGGGGYYICTGPASMLVPVVLQPGEQWRGAQVIEHDNL